MKKKIFTLLTLLACVVGGVKAAETVSWTDMATSNHDANKAGSATSTHLTPAKGVVASGLATNGTVTKDFGSGSTTYYRYKGFGVEEKTDLYFEYSFTVASGYEFTPSKLSVGWAPNGGKAVCFNVYAGTSASSLTKIGQLIHSSDNTYSVDDITDFTSLTNKKFTVIRLVPYGKESSIILNSVSIEGNLASTDTRTAVSLSFSSESTNANLGESFTAPTLTVDPSAAASEVKYSSSNTAAATVDASTGAITLKGGGTTTITAAITGSATYKDASASYTLKVVDPSATGYTDEAASIIWPFQDGTTLTPETLTPSDAFLSTSVSYGSMTLSQNTAVTFKGDDTKYTFNTITNSTGASVSNINLDFVVTPAKGISFKPTKVYFEAARLGHGNGKVTVQAIYGDGTTATLKAEHEVARNNTDGYTAYTTDDIEIASGVASEKAFTLRIVINKLDNGKADAFRNVKITGVVNGTVEAVTTYTITAETNDESLGTVAGGNTYVENAEVTLTATPKTGAKFVKWQKNGVDIEGGATITFTATESATYTAVFKKLYKVSFVAGEGADKGTTANALQTTYEETSYTTPAANYYVSKPGYTATGWTDGTTDYAFGQTITLTADLELKPKFVENEAALSDPHTSAVTVTYNFDPTSGAPILNIENATGYYVQQATINGTAIDVPIYINNVKGSAVEGKTGKTNNASSGAKTAQINEGSKFTIPATSGMTVVLTGSNNISTTTVAGAAPTSGSGTMTATYTYSGSAESIDIVFGGDGKYYSSMVVTYPANAVKKHLSAAGYATHCSSKNLNFAGAMPALTAYKATVSGSKVTFSPIDNAPATTGVLLKGAEGDYLIPIAASVTSDVSDNQLVGVTTATEVAAGSFVLMNGASGVGFYKTESAFTVGANTAYLPASVAAGRTFIGFSDETTGIASMNNEQCTMNSAAYNLQGQRIETSRISSRKPQIIVVGGKKVVVK